LFAACALLAAASAEAQSIGAGAGVVRLEDDDEDSLFLTGNVRFQLIGPLQLEPEVGWWKRTQQAGTAQVRYEDFNLGVNALLVVPGSRIELFVGAGVGAHFLDRTAGIAGIIRDATSTDVAVHVLGGLDVKLQGTLSLFAAIRKDAFGDDTDARDQTKLYGGLRLRF
jgi:hypothetical protein